ncbi:Predicted nucleic acid-binding protein, contains PIN domain [Desulfonatronum zhilinae]|nr:Predicted nucleic acid-binding protein, contains PIN domain [Desulfonatronum zhilinae]
MSDEKTFMDTNVLLYLVSSDGAKADKAESLLRLDPVISVQVLNETVNVLRRKMRMTWPDITEFLDLVRFFCTVEPLTIATFERGVLISQKYMLNFCDSMIVSTALLSGCDFLYSEDLQDGLFVENELRIRNPFENRLS